MQITDFQTKNQLIQKLLKISTDIVLGNNQVSRKTNFCLAGGSTPFEFYSQLSSSNLDFSYTKLWQTDERYVSATDADSNQSKLRETFEQNQDLTLELFDTSLDYELCAKKYGQRLNLLLANNQFDLTILGFGTDGHFGSIFGGENALAELNSTELTICTTAGEIYPISQRLSLTPRALNQSKRIIVILTGNDKKAVIEELQHGQKTTADFPCKYWLGDRKSVV